MKVQLSLKLLIATIVAGIVAFVVDLVLYKALYNTIPNFLLIALMLVVLTLCVVPTIFVLSMLTKDGVEQFFFLEGKTQILIALAVALVVLFGAGMGLEKIYDTDEVDVTKPTAYIFLLDESGSMFGNDPDYLRNEAVNTLMQSVPADTPYAVYVFATDAACVRPMKPYSEGAYTADDALNTSLGGGTAIRNGLELVLQDYHAGQFASGGSALRVILLSDGASSDMGMFSDKKILDDYRNCGISISTVGLGMDDAATMGQIAKKTGGSYIHIENAKQLQHGFSYAAAVSAGRDLFSERNVVDSPLLYAVLRVLFLTVLGAIIVLMKAAAVGPTDSHWLVMIEGWIAAFVASLLVELLTGMGMPVGVGLAVYCILVAATPIYKLVKDEKLLEKESQSYTFRERF